MKTTLQIKIPDGYKINTTKSTSNNLVLELITGTCWDNLEYISGWSITNEGNAMWVKDMPTTSMWQNIWATKEQAEAYLPLIKLSQLVQEANKGWIPDWTDSEMKYVLNFSGNSIIDINVQYRKCFLAFKSEKIRDIFMENKDLIEQAKPLL